MKIAGQKNAGAWFRFNKFLRQLASGTGGQATSFQSVINSIDTLGDYVDALNDLATKAGYNQGMTTPFVAATLAAHWASNGIPLEVWMGKLIFDTYTKATVNGKEVYQPDHADAARAFASDLRDAAKRYKAVTRLVLDIQDVATLQEGNPGGLPDGIPAH